MPRDENKNEVPATITQAAVPALPQEMSLDQVAARVNKVRELQRRLMKENAHYGVIPGTDKPTLYKAGSELMCLTFMFDPQYEHDIKQDGVHREIVSRCVLYHIPTGNRVASGEGSCSTYESKYAWRKSAAECPVCHKELRRSKNKPEWYCWVKMGGCGATYPLSDKRIGSGGRVPNPDIPDQYNTVLKMANKRSLVAAILNATAASEIFTQDLEDFADEDGNKTDPMLDNPEPPSSHPDQSKPKPATVSQLRTPPPPTSEPQAPEQAPAIRPSAPSPKITDGQIRLLFDRLRRAHLLKGDDTTPAMDWLNSEFDLEIVYDDAKTPEECLTAMLQEFPPKRIGEAVKELDAMAKGAQD